MLVRGRPPVRLEDPRGARHARHAQLLESAGCRHDGYAQGVVAGLVVDDVAVQGDSLGKARVERDAELHHLAVRGHRLEGDHFTAEGEAVQRIPSKVAAHVDDEAVRLVAAAERGLMPGVREHGLEDQRLAHPLHVVVVWIVRKREAWLGARCDRLEGLAHGRPVPIDGLGALEAQSALAPRALLADGLWDMRLPRASHPTNARGCAARRIIGVLLHFDLCSTLRGGDHSLAHVQVVEHRRWRVLQLEAPRRDRHALRCARLRHGHRRHLEGEVSLRKTFSQKVQELLRTALPYGCPSHFRFSKRRVERRGRSKRGLLGAQNSPGGRPPR